MKGENSTTLAADQRKQLVAMLDKWGKVGERVVERYRQARQQLVNDFADRKGVRSLVDEIIQLRQTEAERQRQLATLGFELDSDGDLSIDSKTLQKEFDKLCAKELGTEDDMQQKLLQASVKVLTATTAEEATQAVEPLL